MRFIIVIVGCAGTGALSMGTIQQFFPQTAQTFQAITALGGNPANFKISINGLNIRSVYDDVVKKVTSGEIDSSFNFATSPVPQLRFDPDLLKSGRFATEPSIQRSFAAGLSARAQAVPPH